MPDAALMIDWENFYAGREDNAGELFDIGEDLIELSDLALQILRDKNPAMRLAVRRAYADFNARRRTPEGGSQLFLHRTPRQLMDHGVEPVQVFRFPGGSSKNAADMRLAVDALRLMSDGRGLEMFVIVTGDADFIPLAIDLRRMGAYVAVIGIADHTKQIFQRYVDRFDLFEDLVAARRMHEGAGGPLEPVRRALQSILAERSPVVFSAVRPLMNQHLEHPFDPGRFGADNMGDFLRQHAEDLEVRVQRGEHDWEVVPLDAGNRAARAGNGEERPANAPPRASAALYARALQREWPKFFLPPAAEWRRIVLLLAEAATAQSDQPGPAPTPGSLLEEVVEVAEEHGIEEPERKVKAVLFQCLCAGVFSDATSGEPIADASPARWHQPALLVPDDGEALFRAIRQFIVRTVAGRLGKRAGDPRLEAAPLAGLLDGPEPAAESVEDARGMIAALDGA